MRVTKAFRFELDPNAQQRIALAKHVGSARFAYNWGLALCLKALEERKKILLHLSLFLLWATFPQTSSLPEGVPVRGLRLGFRPGPERSLEPEKLWSGSPQGLSASSAGSDACGDRLCGGTGLPLVSEHPVVEAGSGRSSREPPG
jgi:hypothetical protein